MTITRLKTLLGAATIAASFVGGASLASADSLDAIMQVGKERTIEARASQIKIDRLADETRDLLSDYKTVMKQVEGLRVYNARLERHHVQPPAAHGDAAQKVVVAPRRLVTIGELVVRLAVYTQFGCLRQLGGRDKDAKRAVDDGEPARRVGARRVGRRGRLPREGERARPPLCTLPCPPL